MTEDEFRKQDNTGEEKMTKEKQMTQEEINNRVADLMTKVEPQKPQPIPEGDATAISIQQWARHLKPWQRELFILKVRALLLETDNG
jgi:hypothetical protein